MHKFLLFLKRSEDKSSEKFFDEYLSVELSRLFGSSYLKGRVETPLLQESNYEKYIEVSASSSDEMQEILASPEGKRISRELSGYGSDIETIFIETDN